ncbi:MAG TPA: TfoX/Sxy family protein [Stellaceae bacterium]|nr:TfoX/Sxy family protein [Stellaceae bacterium]
MPGVSRLSPSPDDLVAHVLDMLGDWGGVSARRMFSGYGLFRQGAMFGLIARDTFYLRVDDRNRQDFAAAGSRVFAYRRERREVELRGYMECPPDILEDPDEMLRWAKAAAAAALAALAEKPSGKRRRAPKHAAKPSRPR